MDMIFTISRVRIIDFFTKFNVMNRLFLTKNNVMGSMILTDSRVMGRDGKGKAGPEPLFS